MNSLTISRVLHAGYVFASGEVRVLFDPIFENPFSRNCHAYPDVRFDRAAIRRERFDAIFISHYHDDHCSFESLDLLDRRTPVYLYCVHERMFELIRELGFVNVHPLALGRAVEIGTLVVTPVRAFDADVDAIFHVRAGELNVLNVVDALIDDDTLEELARLRWDVVLWPFQTMRELAVIAPASAEPAPEGLDAEVLAQLGRLRPRIVVPSSCQFIHEPWSWVNHAFFPVSYARFAREVGAAVPGARVVRMNPSRAFRLTAAAFDPAPALPWVVPVGDQDVDYVYDPDVTPTPTSEIARRFPALGAAARARVDHFCREDLPLRYRRLDEPEGFRSPVSWRLSVFDHQGREITYHYRVHGRAIEAAPAGPADWSTEVVATKLYAALELGEALTSLYLRVDGADVIEDPLVRTLYTGVFGAYQAAQLRRLAHLRTHAKP